MQVVVIYLVLSIVLVSYLPVIYTKCVCKLYARDYCVPFPAYGASNDAELVSYVG